MKDIFISYSHQDEAWKNALQSQLEPLASYNEFSIWDDRKINLGQDWLPEIRIALSKAKIAVLLVSSNFLNSKFIKTTEIPILLQRRRNEGLYIIPIIVRDCTWRGIDWLSALQVTPQDGKPLAEIEKRHDIEKACTEIAHKINDLLQKIQKEAAARELLERERIKQLKRDAEDIRIKKEQEKDQFKKKIYEILYKITSNPIDRVFFIISVIAIIAIIIILSLIFKLVFSYPEESNNQAMNKNTNPHGEMTLIKGGILHIGCLGKRDNCNYTDGVNDAIYKKSVKVNDFYISNTEVTLDQFSIFSLSTGYITTNEQYNGCVAYQSDGNWASIKDSYWKKTGLTQDDKHPVVCISWKDTQAYLKWLNQIYPGKNYRLPTEAEWEYATRANTETPYSIGNCSTSGQANYNGYMVWKRNGCQNTSNYRKTTTRVGSFAASPWGLYDMHGNVWEWVQDCYHPNYVNIPQDGSAWEEDCQLDNDTKEISRVRRGGSWASPPDYLISARRSHDGETTGLQNTGFRIARSKSPDE